MAPAWEPPGARSVPRSRCPCCCRRRRPRTRPRAELFVVSRRPRSRPRRRRRARPRSACRRVDGAVTGAVGAPIRARCGRRRRCPSRRGSYRTGLAGRRSRRRFVGSISRSDRRSPASFPAAYGDPTIASARPSPSTSPCATSAREPVRRRALRVTYASSPGRGRRRRTFDHADMPALGPATLAYGAGARISPRPSPVMSRPDRTTRPQYPPLTAASWIPSASSRSKLPSSSGP